MTGKSNNMAASNSAAFALTTVLAIGALVAMSSASLAELYPARPLRLIVGQPPGGHSDALGRIVAQRFSEILKQPVVVENRGGAGGTIGAEMAARAPADGYTMLFAGSNNLGLASATMKDLRYTPLDFAPVGTIARVSYGLAVNAKYPIATIGDLVAYCRAHPGKLNYASTGVASTSSLVFELLKRAADVDIVHIPYKGSAIAVNELVSGRIDMMFTDLSALIPLAGSGSVRLIAVAGDKRSSAAADVPTVAEQGYPELAMEPWYGVVVPAGTPADIVAKLNDTLIQTLRTPEIRQRFDRLGYVPLESTAEELGAVIRTEMKTFEALLERLKITPQP